MSTGRDNNVATCRFCGERFCPPKPETKHCRSCHYSGALQAEGHRSLLDDLHEIIGVNEVRFDHTGGGCFGLAIRLSDGRFGFATEAIQYPDGSWYCDAVCPEPGEPWALGLYSSEEGFWNGEESTLFAPLTDSEVVAKLKDVIR